IHVLNAALPISSPISLPTYPSYLPTPTPPPNRSVSDTASLYSYNSISSLISKFPNRKLKIKKSELASVKKTHYPPLSKDAFYSYFSQISDEFSSFKQIQLSKSPSSQLNNALNSSLPPHTVPINPPPLSISQIPPVFFDPDFDLQNPATFSSISSFLVGPNSISSLFDLSAPLSAPPPKPEVSLSTLLDNVELLLIDEIKARSSEFLNATSTLTLLSSSSNSSISQISSLKSHISTLKDSFSSSSQISSLVNKRSNISKCISILQTFSNILDILPIINDLVDSHDPQPALSLVSEIELLLSSIPQISSLSSSSSAFKSLNSHILLSLSSVSDFAITKILSSLNSSLTSLVNSNFLSWNPFFTDTTSPSPIKGFDNTLLSSINAISPDISPLFNGLIRIGKADILLSSISSQLDSLIQSLMQQDYPPSFFSIDSSLDFNDFSVQQSLANSLRKISFDDYLLLLYKQFSRFLLISYHVISLVNSLSDCYSKTSSSLASNSLNSLREKLVDIVHIRINKLIIHRKDQISKLNTSPFYSFFFISLSFVHSFESLSSIPCVDLRNCLLLSSKLYLENLHSEKTKQLLVIIENEQWVQTDAPSDFQVILDNLISSASLSKIDSKSPQDIINSFVNLSNLIPISFSLEKLPPVIPQTTSNIDIIKNFDSLKKRNSHPSNYLGNSSFGSLKQDDQIYPVVGSSLTLLKSIYEYIQLSLHMPHLASISFSCICQILKIYNSRSCQVVLGAGAVLSPAQLKHISAKNIALVARSLDLVLQQLIQPIRDIFVSGLLLLVPKPSSFNSPFSPLDYSEFTTSSSLNPSSFQYATIKSQIKLSTDLIVSVEGDYLAHKNELLTKLVSIMSDRADMHVAKLASTKWDSLASSTPSDLNTDSQPQIPKIDGLETIIREIKKLHKILSKYLDITDIEYIFSQITSIYSNKILASLPHFSITTVAGKSLVIRGFQHLTTQLSSLKGVPHITNQLEVSANNINLVPDYLPQSHSISSDPSSVSLVNRHTSAPPDLMSSKNISDSDSPPPLPPHPRDRILSVNQSEISSANSQSIDKPAVLTEAQKSKLAAYNYETVIVGGVEVKVLVPKNPAESQVSDTDPSRPDNNASHLVPETPSFFGGLIDSPVSPGMTLKSDDGNITPTPDNQYLQQRQREFLDPSLADLDEFEPPIPLDENKNWLVESLDNPQEPTQ
ncbi:Vacuolar protein sorting-associated protein 54, chloroplastic, partial [Smittium mucronatum]